jgi:signal transduction histidine kinase
LGLTIAQAIAVKHGGALTVESALGQGSVFTVKLPLSDENEDGYD